MNTRNGSLDRAHRAHARGRGQPRLGRDHLGSQQRTVATLARDVAVAIDVVEVRDVVHLQADLVDPLRRPLRTTVPRWRRPDVAALHVVDEPALSLHPGAEHFLGRRSGRRR
jgi:hypothetical protein